MAYKKPDPECYFKKAPQNLDEKKSQGQIERSRKRNLLLTARTLYENADILPQMIDNIKNEVEMGMNKNAIELLKVIKEPEEQNINLKGQVQKVFITPEAQKEAEEHIKDFIDG